ncbi:MAG: PAS domain S-box protein [Chlorobi bacterium]|nr:PAS domain S-box protein [Chlorobiota bacterium]
MLKTDKSRSIYKKKINRLTFIISLLWFLIIAISFSWNIITLDKNTKRIAFAEANASINRDAAIRIWASNHGGVSVPIDAETPPNPHLSHIPDRDIVKPNGDTLTLTNPAYMIRQMFDQFPKEYGVVGRLTSLKPINPNNKPDEWERNALHEFEKGKKESSEFIKFRGETYFKLMKPLIAKKSCLKCHEFQGYKEGDILGGIGVSAPMKSLLLHEASERKVVILFHLLILIFGFIGIGFSSNRFSKFLTRQKNDEIELKKHRDNLEEIVAFRTEELEKEISEHKRDREFTKKIIETSEAIIVGLDKNHLIKIFNRGAEKITGYRKEEVIGKDWFQIFFPSEIYEEMNKVWKEAWGKPLYAYENPIIAKSGELKTVSWQSTGFYDDEKADKHLIISIGIDVTKRLNTEKRLEKSRKKYRDLVEKSKDAILIIEDGKFVDCNDATIKILKYKDKTEVLNTHPHELSPLYQPDGKRSDQKAEEMMEIAIKEGSHRFEWYHKKADGEIFPVDVILTTGTNEDGKLIIHTNWRDISEQKKKEKIQKALFDISKEASKDEPMDEFYKSIHLIISGLMPAKNLYIAIQDTETDILTFPYHVDEYDLPPEPKPMGKGFTEFVLRTKKSQIINMERDKKLRLEGEVELIGDNSPIWIGNYLDLSENRKGVLVVQDYKSENAFSEDDIKLLQFVSQQIEKVLSKKFADRLLKESLRKLAQSKEELELINRNKDRFFSIIAHDLKSPFMALMGISQMLDENIEELSEEEIQTMIKSINTSTNNLYKLIENLLHWARLQRGSVKIIPKTLQLSTAVAGVKESLSLAAESKKISIRVETSDKHFVYADEDCLKTILRNLINNAIKFTNENGIITIYSVQNSESVQITVEDNGVGMNAATLGKLFSLTEKVSERGTANETGTGLGLILCKELGEKNGGKIWAESELGKGSKFIFTLPIEKKSAD